MSVRAKFYVASVNHNIGNAVLTMYPVTRGADNKVWASATPSGTLTMTVLNELASEQFHPGDEWFVDFTPAPKGVEGMG